MWEGLNFFQGVIRILMWKDWARREVGTCREMPLPSPRTCELLWKLRSPPGRANSVIVRDVSGTCLQIRTASNFLNIGVTRSSGLGTIRTTCRVPTRPGSGYLPDKQWNVNWLILGYSTMLFYPHRWYNMWNEVGRESRMTITSCF